MRGRDARHVAAHRGGRADASPWRRRTPRWSRRARAAPARLVRRTRRRRGRGRSASRARCWWKAPRARPSRRPRTGRVRRDRRASSMASSAVSTGIATPPGRRNAARRSTRDNDSYRESGAEDSTLDSDSYRPQSGARAPPNWASPGGVGAGSAAWRPAGEEGECHGEDGTGCWRRRLLLRRSPCIGRCGASGRPWRRWRGGAGVAGERWRVRIGSRTAHPVRTPGAHTRCAHPVRTPGAHTRCAHPVRTPHTRCAHPTQHANPRARSHSSDGGASCADRAGDAALPRPERVSARGAEMTGANRPANARAPGHAGEARLPGPSASARVPGGASRVRSPLGGLRRLLRVPGAVAARGAGGSARATVRAGCPVSRRARG